MRLFFLLLVACAARVSNVDTGPLSLVSNDPTGIVAGCGQQATVGYVYCRKTAGDDTTDALLEFAVPPAVCPLAACSSLVILSPTGAPALRLDAPKGQTSITVKWSDLTGTPTFTADARGFWPFVLTVHWTDSSGNPQETVTDGEVRLRVLAKGYQTLGDGWSPSSFAWQWTAGAHEYGMTTAGRVQTRKAVTP